MREIKAPLADHQAILNIPGVSGFPFKLKYKYIFVMVSIVSDANAHRRYIEEDKLFVFGSLPSNGVKPYRPINVVNKQRKQAFVVTYFQLLGHKRPN